MPTWIQGPNGPTYVDEQGNPTSPLGPASSTNYGLDPQAIYELYNFNEAAAPQAVPQEPNGVSATEGTVPSPASEPQAPSPVATPAQPDVITQVGARVGNIFDQGQYNQVEKTQKGLEGELSAARQQAEQRGEELVGMAATSAGMARDSARGFAEAEAEKLTAQGVQDSIMADLQRSFATEEMNAHAEAQAASQASRARFEGALADYRASQVDPGRLLRGPGLAVAGATAFLSGFLGAKGIKTDSMDMLNRAIDRDIDGQITALNQKGKVAEGFKTLWDMQRQESASDAEARSRVKVFMLQAAKDQVASEMAKYDSALAQKRGEVAIATINEQLVKEMSDIYKQVDTNAFNLMQQRIDMWKTRIQASLQSRGLNIQQQQVDVEKAKLGKEADLSDFIIREPSRRGPDGEVIPGRVLGRADTKEEKIELQNKIVGAHAGSRSLLELQEMQRQIGSKYSGKGSEALDDTDRAMLTSKYNEIIGNLILERSGKAANKEEVERIKQEIPFDTLTRGLFTGDAFQADRVSAMYGIGRIDRVRDESTARVRPLDPAVAEKYAAGGGADLLEPERTAQSITAEGRIAGTSPAAAAMAKLVSPEAKEPSSDKRVQRDWEAARKHDPIGLGSYQAESSATKTAFPHRAPTWVDGVQDLYESATLPSYDPADRAESRQRLIQLATEMPLNNEQAAMQAMAQYYLNEMAKEE